MELIGFTTDENTVLIKMLNEQVEKLENFSSIEKQILSPTLDESIKLKVAETIDILKRMIHKIENLTNI